MSEVSKSYPFGDGFVDALKNVSVNIAAGEFVAVMGASGSGKSTMMNLLGCLDRPTAGHISIGECDVAQMDDAALATLRNEKIGFVFQTFELLPRLTALRNVELPFLYARDRSLDARALAREALMRVGLAERMDHRPDQMSGGQRQRAAIARAIVRRPPLLLADEPTGNLDKKTTREILELFRDLNSQGHTIVVVTHEDAVAAFCDRVLLLEDGVLVKDERRRDGERPVPENELQSLA